MVHREVVSISPHHIYSESIQPGFTQNVSHLSETTTQNIASFPVSRSSNQLGQPQSIPQAPPQQHITTSNATNLTYSLQNLSMMDNNVVYVRSEGIPIMRKSESESISSGDSNEDSSPPDTSINAAEIMTNSGLSGGSNSSSIISKKFKVRSDSKLSSRHKVSQHQPQQIVYTHIMPQSALSSEIVLAPTATQSQTQQTITQPQPSPQTIQNINSPTAIQAIGIANPQVIFQQYAPTTHPMQKSQMNQTYPYTQQHIPMSNRSSILSPNTTTSAPQSAAPTYRLPSYHMQPNGDVIYQLPTTFAYMPQTALPLTRPPSTCNQTHTVVPTSMQHMPTLTSLSSKSNQNPMVSPFLLSNENSKPITSCFNCGSSQHTGQECQEASMEDVTRAIYKLDYNSTLINDVNSAPELDNGSGKMVGKTTTDAHMPSSVLNK